MECLLIGRRGSRMVVAKAPLQEATPRPDAAALIFSGSERHSSAIRRTARIDFVCNVTFAMAVLGCCGGVRVAGVGSAPVCAGHDQHLGFRRGDSGRTC
jgi:hypothetical protein